MHHAMQARHKLSTPAEEELVLQGRQLWLMPQELVYIPIKFQASSTTISSSSTSRSSSSRCSD